MRVREEKLSDSFPYIQDQKSGERGLWCAVIERALFDAMGKRVSAKAADEIATEQAKRWLLYKNKDFPFICDLANIPPNMVRRQVKKMLGMVE